MSKTSFILLIVVIGLIILCMILMYYLINRSIKISESRLENEVKKIKSSIGFSYSDKSITVLESLDQISATIGQVSYGSSLMNKCSEIKEELEKLTEYAKKSYEDNSITDSQKNTD